MWTDEDLQISMPDGVKLSARCWFPDGAGPGKGGAAVPAILEMLPYRKRDVTAPRDATTHVHFAYAGYACFRVDLRGCGDSEGLFDDEYSAQELADIKTVIEWIADQAWCTGRVGIMGISWGGFNGLQVAALRPKGLEAVISACSSADRYADDIHFKGGCLLGDNIAWAANMLGRLALPPDPALRDDWRDTWMARLENTQFLAKTWHEHRDRDAYWRHGSVCEDYSAIEVPVLSIGGWHDGYRNTPRKLIEGLDAPCRVLIGPWNHKYPNIAAPPPRIDFVGECLRWWDRWLKDVDTGVEQDPPQRLWMMESAHPQRLMPERPGRWIGVPANLDEVTRPHTLHLHPNRLTNDPSTARLQAHIAPDPACGQAAGVFFPSAFPAGDVPADQRADDARSLCFDTDVLQEDLHLVKGGTVSLTVQSDGPAGLVMVRLCDVRPDGTSLLLSHGMVDLRYRDGFETASPVPAHTELDVTVVLDDLCSRVPAGHRLRLAISPCYWPFLYPDAGVHGLTLQSGTVTLHDLNGPLMPVADFAPPRDSAPDWTDQRNPDGTQDWTVEDGWHVMRRTDDGGRQISSEHGLWIDNILRETWRVSTDDAGDVSVGLNWTRRVGRGDWSVTIETETTLAGKAGAHHITTSLSAFEDNEEVFSVQHETEL